MDLNWFRSIAELNTEAYLSNNGNMIEFITCLCKKKTKNTVRHLFLLYY